LLSAAYLYRPIAGLSPRTEEASPCHAAWQLVPLALALLAILLGVCLGAAVRVLQIGSPADGGGAGMTALLPVLILLMCPLVPALVTFFVPRTTMDCATRSILAAVLKLG
jgi:hypothetical protein